jgi:hypothetical protein
VESIEVRIGQVWADNDKRSSGRKVRIVEVDRTHATVELVSERGRPWSGLRPGEPARAEPGRRTRIRLDRFKPTTTGYRLAQDVEG